MCKHFPFIRKLIKDVTFIKNLQMKNHCTKTYMYTVRKTVISPSRLASFYSILTTHTKDKIKHQFQTSGIYGEAPTFFKCLTQITRGWMYTSIDSPHPLLWGKKLGSLCVVVLEETGGRPELTCFTSASPQSPTDTPHCHPSTVELLLRHHVRKEFC